MSRPKASTRFVTIKNRLVHGKLMSRQILTRFDSDKKIYSSTTENRLACSSLYQFFHFFCFQIMMDKDMHRSEKTRQPTCDSYAIIKVPGTNVFVIVTKSPDCFSNRASCPCHDTCTSDEKNACECPCKSRLEYNFCSANLTGER